MQPLNTQQDRTNPASRIGTQRFVNSLFPKRFARAYGPIQLRFLAQLIDGDQPASWKSGNDGF
jgi:hypothetical protein